MSQVYCYPNYKNVLSYFLKEIMSSANKLADRLLIKSVELSDLKKLMELVPVPMFICNSSGTYVFVNERYCNMLGATDTEVLGEGWVKFVHQDDFNLVSNRWNLWLKDKVPYSLKHRYVSRKGTTISATVNIESIFGLHIGTVIPTKWKLKL